MINKVENKILILDFGSQVTQLIARRLREMGYYNEIEPFHCNLEKIKNFNPKGIILSGGPSSVYEKQAPLRDVQELLAIAPLMGICYGMQLIAHQLGGEVKSSAHREYGLSKVVWSDKSPTDKSPPDKSRAVKLPSVSTTQSVWMSHGDIVHRPPENTKVVAVSENGLMAAYVGKNIFAVQFHPEVSHTEQGDQILNYFVREICHLTPDWDAPHMLETMKAKVLQQVQPDEAVLCALSGGVDSSVVAVLLTKILGPQRVFCVFVDNGLLRKNEFTSVMKQYENLGLNVRGVDASQRFITALSNQEEPEVKRKTIGRVFIEVFDHEVQSLKKEHTNIKYLAQGTLYPDVIESVSFSGGPSHTIKSHHNVGGLPEKMNLKLLEPVRELFKDEVRRLGHSLNIDAEIIGRHPFPGPGLSIRILGEVTEERLHILREADAIFIDQLRKHNLYHKIWQAFCVLLPVKTVGVQGDGRTYEQVLGLRAVTSIDGMTADWYPFEYAFLKETSNAITNQVKGINRVVYDITSKPPATIEWE